MKLSDLTIACLGAGNMAEALVSGLVAGGVCPAQRITVTDVRSERLDFFSERFGVSGTSDNAIAVRGADIVLFAVKPQVMAEVVGSVRSDISSGVLSVSIAAGIPCRRFEEWLGGQARVVRAMPNTPALAGMGATAICAGTFAEPEDLDVAETLLSSVGLVVRVKEPLMDAVTALSGSGPAYVFYVLEAMIEAATELGLAPDTARQLAMATVGGAAKLMDQTGLPADELRRRVTSKGGTTEAAIRTLDAAGVKAAIMQALRAAHQRSRELAAG